MAYGRTNIAIGQTNVVIQKGWVKKTWKGFTNLFGQNIWSKDGHYYYSNGAEQYELQGDTWVAKTWAGIPYRELQYFTGNKVCNIHGWYLMIDLNREYPKKSGNWYSNWYKLNTSNEWELDAELFTGRIQTNLVTGNIIFKDGMSYYYILAGYNDNLFRLSGWEWVEDGDVYGNIPTSGKWLWQAGENNNYASYGTRQWRRGDAKNWYEMTWSGITNFYGWNVWSKDNHYYLSQGTEQWELQDINSTVWVKKTWKGFTNLFGQNIWSKDGHYYYSNGAEQYELKE